ncbi:hypothetical protein E2C01_095591 [Portunus trituberculatus]|uniref:Uncharacterized protein n=1 Tax=Portunus trituberculatus TaxID=210409 RepID=A0A5B7K4F3_PORTR|nr:hypothetical protein [Portunus trituberculatus]
MYSSVLSTKTQNCRKTQYMSKEVKYVKNGLFQCILAFYAPNSEILVRHYIC